MRENLRRFVAVESRTDLGDVELLKALRISSDWGEPMLFIPLPLLHDGSRAAAGLFCLLFCDEHAHAAQRLRHPDERHGCILCESRRLRQKADGLTRQLADAKAALATARATLEAAEARLRL